MISKDGIRPSPYKIEAIKDMPPPKNVGDLRTIIGMLKYNAKFVHNLATMIKPMSDLPMSDTEWYWGKAQEKAFIEAKTALTEVPSLRFYCCNSRTEVSARCQQLWARSSSSTRTSKRTPSSRICIKNTHIIRKELCPDGEGGTSKCMGM